MDKYYALCFVESSYLSELGVKYTIIEKHAKREPSMKAWQQELEKMGDCPTIAWVMSATHAEKRYHIEGNYAYEKR